MPVNPTAYDVRGYAHRPPSPFRPLLWLLPLLIGVVALISWGVWHLRQRRAETPVDVPVIVVPRAPVKLVAAAPAATNATPTYWRKFVMPTDRANLSDGSLAECFQDTGTGNPESGTYGTVRTGESGLGQFHEGIDIKCLKRDRHGQPLDKIYAVADGRVAYASRIGGNSNYGKYIVLLHQDAIGEVYTLYAHLAEIDSKIQPGATVAAGDQIGIMGHTSSGGIPVERAHLHFEIGLVVNARFDDWYRAKKLKPDHGAWHGWNLLGVNPLDALRFERSNGRMDFGLFLATVTPAFSVVIKAPQPPDFFRRYPSLWTGPAFDGSPMVISANENGAPLSAHLATTDERAKLGRTSAAVVAANATALGRNGRRIVTESRGAWKIGSNGNEWLEILLYPSKLR